MEHFFARDYTGPSFQLFGLPHLIALTLVVLVNAALIFRGQQFPDRWRHPFRIALAAVLIVDEILWHGWNWATGQWTIQTMLPLHLCSLLVFLSALLLITKSYSLYEFVYFFGIAGASQALLTPDLGRYGFPHFRFFQAFVSHGSIVTAAVFMTAVERYRPFLKSIWRIVLGGNIYLLLVAGVNALIGSNYLFIAHKPDTASLLDLLPPWPWYILFIEVIAFTLVFLLYLPFAIKDPYPH